VHQFIRIIRLVFHKPYLWNKAGDPQYLFHFWNEYSKSLSVRSGSSKKSIKYKIFVRTSFREVFRTVELSCGTTYGSCVLLTPAIECRLAIDISIDRRSTLDRHLGRPLVDPRLTHGWHLGRQTFIFRWHSMEWRSILAMTTHWMSVDVSIATLRSAVGRMSVVCQWCIGSMSVMYSSQYPSSPRGYSLIWAI